MSTTKSQWHPPVDRSHERIQRAQLHHARLIVDVVNDEAIQPVLDDLRNALMRTGHGPRIDIREERSACSQEQP